MRIEIDTRTEALRLTLDDDRGEDMPFLLEVQTPLWGPTSRFYDLGLVDALHDPGCDVHVRTQVFMTPHEMTLVAAWVLEHRPGLLTAARQLREFRRDERRKTRGG
jgi:hypothetical protein